MGCVSYIRGSSSGAKTMKRLQEIEVIDGSLGKISALDYTMKCLAETNKSMTKHEFREKLEESQTFQTINDLEVDLLFQSLDSSKDGYLNSNDFRSLSDLGRKSSEDAKGFAQKGAM